MAKIRKRMKLYLIIILLLVHITCFASPRITVKKEFENVILFYDGNTNNEEYAKLEFIAERVLLLSKQYNYSQNIILNYLFSDEEKVKEYFITYSKPTYFYKHKNFDELEEIKLLDSNKQFIMLTAYDETRSQIEALKLIDYALSDFNSFKSLDILKIQYDRFEFEYNYVYSIKSEKIKKIINEKSNSDFVKIALTKKLYREPDNKEDTYFISYFTKNDKYFPYLREGKIEKVLDTLTEVRYYARDLNSVFIFKNRLELNFYAFPNLGEDLIIKRNVSYNDNLDFTCSNIFVNEILTGVYLINYEVGSLGTIECSIYTIEKGMIEMKLSEFEYRYPFGF